MQRKKACYRHRNTEQAIAGYAHTITHFIMCGSDAYIGSLMHVQRLAQAAFALKDTGVIVSFNRDFRHASVLETHR